MTAAAVAAAEARRGSGSHCVDVDSVVGIRSRHLRTAEYCSIESFVRTLPVPLGRDY